MSSRGYKRPRASAAGAEQSVTRDESLARRQLDGAADRRVTPAAGSEGNGARDRFVPTCPRTPRGERAAAAPQPTRARCDADRCPHGVTGLCTALLRGSPQKHCPDTRSSVPAGPERLPFVQPLAAAPLQPVPWKNHRHRCACRGTGPFLRPLAPVGPAPCSHRRAPASPRGDGCSTRLAAPPSSTCSYTTSFPQQLSV